MGQIGTGKRPGHGAESGASALYLLGADVQRLLRAGHHVIGVRAGRVVPRPATPAVVGLKPSIVLRR
jgi:hypothetical protein